MAGVSISGMEFSRLHDGRKPGKAGDFEQDPKKNLAVSHFYHFFSP